MLLKPRINYCLAIISLGLFIGTPIADSIRQEFVDNLLNVYEELETRFAKQVYLFYKGFQFRTLWNVDKKMETFQRRAASLAKGTGNLQGVTTIEAALHEITNIEKTARTCFTGIHHRVGIKRWSFDSTNNARVCNT